ncbi:MAG: SpoIIE family protein phosphatase [Clostridia bacterium]|nr:SpoIIE family protein phosphatase [Clostridia bacterium]
MQENIDMERVKKQTGAKEGTSISLRVIVKWLLMEFVWAVGGWLLGQAELAFEVFPLGIAFLCASGSHTLPILVGALFAGVWYMETPAIYIAVYVAAALIRLVAGLWLETAADQKPMWKRLLEHLFSKLEFAQEAPKSAASLWSGQALSEPKKKGLFNEGIWLRISAGAICALILALYRVLANDFQYYDFFAAVFSVLVTVVATVIYSMSLNGQAEKSLPSRISRTVLLFSLVYAAKTVAVIGLPLAPVLAFLFTLYTTKREGTAMGAICAAVVGIACDPLHAPAYLLAALVCGMMKKEDHGVGVAAISAFAALTWLVYIEGVSALLVYLPSFLLSGTAYTVVDRFFSDREPATDAKEDEDSVRLRMEGTRHKDANDRFRGISEAFSSLSEVFYNLSDRFRRPGSLDLRRVCDRSFDRYCTDCPHKTVCWGMEYSNTVATVNRLTSALHTKGKVTLGQIPPSLAHRCEQLPEILESINRDCAKLTGEMLRNNRTEIFAMDYEAAASIINDALAEDDGEYRFDTELEQKISEYLSDAGVRAERVTVYGKRRRQIAIHNVEAQGAKVSIDTLCADLSEMSGSFLDRPMFELDGKSGTMTLRAKRKFSVTGAQSNVSADGGVSGDSVNLFFNKQDFFYALINDGMGAGREAAATSNLCSVFLEKMLRAGNRANTSVRVLNNLVCSRSSDSVRECSSTVDLLELDLMTGDCVFIKSGAAPSFVVRQGTVHRLECGSAPIGILNGIEAQSTAFCLKEGDLVVMISDGILQDDSECGWLMSYLAASEDRTPEELVAQIMSRSSDSERHDDCSVIALRIEAVRE